MSDSINFAPEISDLSPQTVACLKPDIGGPTPLVEAVCQSTTFVQKELSSEVTCTYSRVDNPTVAALETTLGRLENAPPSVCFSSGLAAETALFLALLQAGDHIVLSQAIYGGTARLIRELFSGLGVEADFVDATNPQNIADAIRENTKLVFIETPANPTLCLNDIEAIAAITRSRGIPLAVDNTFLTPVLQQPLELGADISVYSTTKHIEGHSSALGGAITTRNEKLLERLRWVRKSTGTIQTPQNAWVTQRGIKTLPLRIQQHSRHASIIARALADDDRLVTVNYPGLPEFTQSELATRQHRGGHGGVISFEIQGGYETTCRFLKAVKLCTLVEHIGSVETLLTHPASMTHADVPRDQLSAVGLTPGLVRLSVGLEDPQDILADLFAAIDAALVETHTNGKGEPACVTAV
ncbi:MAG: trans-sulfuration enzyme family protein [Pirellulaceae bacterium]